MLKLFFILLGFVVVGAEPTTAAAAADAAPCVIEACNAQVFGGKKCAGLSYYLANCSGCGEKLGRKCAQDFCENFPNSCENIPGKKHMTPIPNLSNLINSHERLDDGKPLSICTAPLFPYKKYGDPEDGRDNTNIQIDSLNTFNYEALVQTKGGLPRALNTVRLFATNYLVAEAAVNKKKIDDDKLKAVVNEWFKSQYGVDTENPDQVNFEILNYLMEKVRIAIFNLKGIKTQPKIEHLKGESKESCDIVMTVSDLGCPGEHQ